MSGRLMHKEPRPARHGSIWGAAGFGPAGAGRSAASVISIAADTFVCPAASLGFSPGLVAG